MHAAHVQAPDMNSPGKLRKRISKKVKEIRGEKARWEGTETGGRIWTMVSNRRTLVQWWKLPFNNQSFWGGRRGGASCWQCQGPYQLVSASATETNDWATALLYVYHLEMHSRGTNSYIFLLLCCMHSQQCNLSDNTVHTVTLLMLIPEMTDGF